MGGYLSYMGTGANSVDAILAALESAGRCYHHTECWDDPLYGEDKSPNDRIQGAANAAGAEVISLRAQVAAIEAEIARLKTPECVLVEFERLCRDSLVTAVTFCDGETLVEVFVDGRSDDPEEATHEIDGAPSLVEVFARLRGPK